MIFSSFPCFFILYERQTSDGRARAVTTTGEKFELEICKDNWTEARIGLHNGLTEEG